MMSAWLQTQPAREEPRFRLICLHRAGGTARDFDGWQARLPASVELVAAQFPGRSDRFLDEALTDMTAVSRALVSVLDALPPLPCALFGDCMGALVGFALVREMRARGMTEPQLLFAAAYPSPEVPRPTPHRHALDDRAFVDHLRDIGSFPDDVFGDLEMLELLLPAFRADFELFETYQHSPDAPLSSDIYVLDAKNDPTVVGADLDLWSHHTAGRYRRKTFDGAHDFIHGDPAVLATVAETLQELIVERVPES